MTPIAIDLMDFLHFFSRCQVALRDNDIQVWMMLGATDGGNLEVLGGREQFCGALMARKIEKGSLL